MCTPCMCQITRQEHARHTPSTRLPQVAAVHERHDEAEVGLGLEGAGQRDDEAAVHPRQDALLHHRRLHTPSTRQGHAAGAGPVPAEDTPSTRGGTERVHAKHTPSTRVCSHWVPPQRSKHTPSTHRDHGENREEDEKENGGRKGGGRGRRRGQRDGRGDMGTDEGTEGWTQGQGRGQGDREEDGRMDKGAEGWTGGQRDGQGDRGTGKGTKGWTRGQMGR